MATHSTISKVNQALVRKSLTGGLFIAPTTAAALTRTNLFDADGELADAGLPVGWGDLGITTDEGLRFGRAQETDTLTGWQFLEPVREDRTSDTETVTVDLMETNKLTLEAYTGANLSAVTYVNRAMEIQKPKLPTDRYYRIMAMSVDNIDGDEFYFIYHYPRAKVTTWTDQGMGKTGAIQYGMTFTSYVDPTLSYAKSTMLGGPGFAALAVAMGFPAVT